jgi:AraC family transcriptional regulator, L-rhamnose operon transcriptional activator RhaR
MPEFCRPGETVSLFKAQHHIVPCQPHAHDDFLELVYIEAGRGTHHVGTTSHDLIMGDTCIIRPGITHSLEAAPGSELTIINCLVSMHALEHEFPEFRDPKCKAFRFFSSFVTGGYYDLDENMHLRHKDSQKVKCLLDMMQREYTQAELGYIPLLEAYVSALIFLVIRLYSQPPVTGGEDRLRTIQDVMQYLRQNYYTDIKVSDVARLYFVSTKYLCRLFKKHTGQTVVEYIQDLRIEMAAKLLASTDYPVRTIALNVGYNDATFFYCLFKEKMGTTPGEYRERIAREGMPPTVLSATGDSPSGLMNASLPPAGAFVRQLRS